jgi:hypothetical protein
MVAVDSDVLLTDQRAIFVGIPIPVPSFKLTREAFFSIFIEWVKSQGESIAKRQ